MRIAFPYDYDHRRYDPARITLSPEYIFLENTYSPLIEIDGHGVVTSGVASKFEWVGEDAVFTIRKGLKTIDGWEITAADAANSLKRLLLLTGNTHGNLQDLLCGGRTLSSLAEDCPGIAVEGETLILRPGARRPFLFSMLAAIDFAVIPTKAINKKTLEIEDYRNTSGPYYVEKDESGGHITLRANPSHYHYSPNIAQRVELIPMDRADPRSSITALEAGHIDAITTVDAVSAEDVLQFYKQHADVYTLHSSMHLRNIVLTFTGRGLRVFNREQRLSIGKQLRKAFAEYSQSTLAYKPSVQFFPVLGEGGLSNGQLGELKAAFEGVPDHVTFDAKGEKVPLVRLALRKEFNGILQHILPGIEVVDGRNPTFQDFSHNQDAMPLFYIAGPDTGFLEDIGLISYSMNAGYLKVAQEHRKQWLNTYGSLENKEERIAMLNKAHAETLLDAVVIPLAVVPYTALTTNDWDIQLSQFFSNNQLWLYKKKS